MTFGFLLNELAKSQKSMRDLMDLELSQDNGVVIVSAIIDGGRLYFSDLKAEGPDIAQYELVVQEED